MSELFEVNPGDEERIRQLALCYMPPHIRRVLERANIRIEELKKKNMSDGEYQIPDEYRLVKNEGDIIRGHFEKRDPEKSDDEYMDEFMEKIKQVYPESYNITKLIKGNFVRFDSYRQGLFTYVLRDFRDVDDYTDYSFPVPIDDIGTATLSATDKAITYMRWIRKAIQDKTFIKL